MEKKIVIIGAGPTGLGAAYRLQELGYKNWAIYEANNYVGGLASSFKDKKGFTWDTGGHVIFSHYPYFDKLFEKLMKGEYLEHEREAWIWLMNRFIPYPFQNNIKYLPRKKVLECLIGLLEAPKNKKQSQNFKEWILEVFGEGIAKYFMFPYNREVWAWPLETMNKDWMAERVSVIDMKRILENVILDKDDVSWGPNARFKFPLFGGTSNFFNRFTPYIKSHLRLNKEIKSIDVNKKIIYFKDKKKESYDFLLNTMPLNQFILKSNFESLKKEAKKLKHNSGIIVGIGLKGKVPQKLETKGWLYFPEDKTLFFRITMFSNYSSNNTPKGNWSLMADISYSNKREIDKKNIINRVIQGMIKSKLIDTKSKIISRWSREVEFFYPIPTLDLRKVLKKIQTELMKKDVYSRGRFGAWRYEIGNMDHSVMQGVEAVDKIVSSKQETVWQP